MSESITRGEYTFVGSKAAFSANYYDYVVSHEHHGDLLYLAWEAAHKFGQRMIGENVASFRDGIVLGSNALDAAEAIDRKREDVYRSLPEFNRSKKLKSVMNEYYQFISIYYQVTIRKM